MDYFRGFLNLFRERATAVRNYISVFVFGETKTADQDDVFYDAQDDVFYDTQDDDNLPTTLTALKGGVIRHTFKVRGVTDPMSFLESTKPSVIRLVKPETKIYIVLGCTMKKINPADKTEETVKKYFRSQTHVVFPSYIESTYDDMVEEILEKFARYQMDGSGWTLKSTDSLVLSTARWVPWKGSSYIPLPAALKNKKALINIKNQDRECFKWSVTRSLNPVSKHPERVTGILKEQSEKYNWDGLSFPTPLNEIARFEKNNSVSITVVGNNGDNRVYPLQTSKYKFDTKVELMLITDEVGDSHYVVVKGLSRLLYGQASKKHGERFYCFNCFNGFTSEMKLQEHALYCDDRDCVKTTLPTLEKNTLKFKNFKNTQRHPFIIFADFECFTKPLDVSGVEGKTIQYQHHEPSGFCFYVKCSEPGVYDKEPVMYTKQSEHDNDVSKKFVECLENALRDIDNLLENPKKMIYEEEEKLQYKKSSRCYICQSEFNSESKGLVKVRDHCHLTGRYKGAAHSKCNLDIRSPKFIPVVFHNLEGYDSHLFIKILGGDLSCIPKNDEKFISFTKNVVVGSYTDASGEDRDRHRKLRFIDSFKFMNSGLAKLVENLEKVKVTNKFYKGRSLDLLLRKGVYPYDYMSGYEKLSETKLPSIEDFYNRLNNENISQEDYDHAQNVWNHFDCETMRDYHDLYLKSDVLLLADVFENFRDLCLENYKLDPAYYYTAPGLFYDACLKKTKINLELLTDPTMHLMIENGIRGGVSMISHRHSVANNKYMKNYDPTKKSKYIMYLDANNLYGYAMAQPLPTDGFRWMDFNELKNWRNMPSILEVDLEYPIELHDLHNEYPLAPERMTIGKVDKLVPNLNDKTKYVVHHTTLKLYESLGLKITKIHKGITFNESPWLAEYINMNTALRTKATSNFEKDFFKLANNSVFGKTMENVRNRVDVRLVTNVERLLKLTCKPNYQSNTIFSDDLIAVHMKRTDLVLNKPIYLGMSILDISKNLMYNFYYNYIKQKFGSKAKLLFTDTDSLNCNIETEDFYKDISLDVDKWFDTSNYPKDHVDRDGNRSAIPVGKNKKVPGLFKDECGGKIMTEFVGLRAKLYACDVEGVGESKKCKGVKTSTVRKDITLANYRECLYSGVPQTRSMNVIRSRGHELYSERITKVALCPKDDKRIILEDRVSTLAIGHYSLKEN